MNILWLLGDGTIKNNDAYTTVYMGHKHEVKLLITCALESPHLKPTHSSRAVA